ncbi:hypothetical protein HZB74_03375 [Candidatus Saccharibacteria bacterium]|nr:hypothetical protein [Candidatus Saccharibacteria bacterium]
MIYCGTEPLTREALAAQIERVVDAYPDSLMVGSVGRAAVYNEVYDDPLHEYRLREQEPIYNGCGERGDIDLVGAPPDASESHLGPFPIDTRAFSNDNLKIIKHGGDWILRSVNRGYEKTIDPYVFTPVQAVTIYGVECRVPPAQTQLALMSLTGTKRSKDVEACAVLSRAIQDGQIDEVCPEALQPFYELGWLNSQSLGVRLADAYRAIIPEKIRLRLSPAVGPIRRYVDARF